MSFIKGAHQGNSVERIKTIVIHEIPTAALITGDLFMMPTLLNIFPQFICNETSWRVISWNSGGSRGSVAQWLGRLP